MTYCVGMLLDEGLVMASDSRTNAGVDRVSTFHKMFHFERPGERTMCLVTAGNLSVTQAAVGYLKERLAQDDIPTLYNAPNLFEAARVVGDTLREVYDRDREHLEGHGVAFTAEAIFGGQIGDAPPRLFRIYGAGNFIEASAETPYFQIGETKYGKPILDRIVEPTMSLSEAARCALISFDSTMRANISVGPPIDLLCYPKGGHGTSFRRRLQDDDPDWMRIRTAWAEGLKRAFADLPDPGWEI
jgi:putative proteasome-type protease